MNHSQINLYFSHSVQQLSELLAEKVSQQQANASIFDAPQVLVPNGNMQRYLQLSMANINGVCAHVDFPFLETGLFQIVNELLNTQSSHLNGPQVAWSIWKILQDDGLLNLAVYQPIKNYLNTDNSSQLLAKKRWQLSQKLAKLMLDYESQRPEMVYQWLQDKQVFQNSENKHLKQLEQMQQNLYQRLFNTDTDTASLTLLQATLKLNKQPTSQNNSLQAIHVFTPSRLSQLHRQLLLQLGRFIEVNIYSLNVCSEYWEDLQTDAEIRWQQRVLRQYKTHATTVTDQAGGALKDSAEGFAELTAFEDENPILKAWGKPGRETLKLFSDIEESAISQGIEYQDQWLVPELSSNNSLLHTVQNNILQRSAEGQQLTNSDALNSIQFANAPSVHREVEAVYNSVLWNLQQNPYLALNEIAVLVADMDKYRFVIEQVFETLNRQHDLNLTYAIVDSSAAKESRYAEAVIDLFAVLDDDFIRSSVFKWLDNSCVQTANHFGMNDWQDWLLVVDHLGIYAGFTQLYEPVEAENSVDGLPDEVFEGECVPVDELFTWKQGLERLHLSLASLADDDLDVSSIGAESIGQLSVLLERLHQYKVRFNQQQQQSTVQWEQQLNQMFESLIAVPSDDQGEQNIQLALQQSLLQLAESQPDLMLGFEDIKQFINHELQELPASKGSYLSGGVVCAALQPMRPIPFKITYILGLDEKTFPGQVRHETLDLTQRSRRIGDINTVENNNYLLLETLMCTREKLYLSYVGLDLLKDEVVEPSASFTTLKQYCDTLLDNTEFPKSTLPIAQLPLDATQTASYHESDFETFDWAINYSYSDYLLKLIQKSPDWQPPKHALTALQLKHWNIIESNNLQTTNASKQLSEQQDEDTVTPLSLNEISTVDTDELAAYLANPQAAMLQQLGVNPKHPEDLSLVEHEPHQLTHLIKHTIFKDAIKQWLLAPQTTLLSEAIKKQHAKQLALSKAPFTLFADLDTLSQVADDLEQVLKVELTGKQTIHVLQVGNALVSATADMQSTGVDIKLPSGQNIQLCGVAEQLYALNGVLTDQVIISSSKKSDVWSQKILKPFVNWCLWQLSDDIQVSEAFKVHVVFPDKVKTVTLRPWHAGETSFATRSTIEKYLQQLLNDYMTKPAQFLPSQLLNQLNLKIDAKADKAIPIKNHRFNTLCSYLAFEQEELSAEDIQSLIKNYEDSLKWPSYEEVMSIIEPQSSEQPLADYRRHLLPVFAMVFGQFESLEQGDKS